MQIQVQGTVTVATGALAAYDPAGHFCELQHCVAQTAHGPLIRSRLDGLGLGELVQRGRAAEAETPSTAFCRSTSSRGSSPPATGP